MHACESERSTQTLCGLERPRADGRHGVGVQGTVLRMLSGRESVRGAGRSRCRSPGARLTMPDEERVAGTVSSRAWSAKAARSVS